MYLENRVRRYFSFYDIMHMGVKDEPAQINYAKRVKTETLYYLILLPTTAVKDAIGEYRKKSFMSLTIFKAVEFTPAKLKKSLFGEWKLTAYPSLIVETMDGRRMEAFEVYQYQNYNGEQEEMFVLSEAMFHEIQNNFVHPRLNMHNYTQFSYEVGGPGEREKVYFEFYPGTRAFVAEQYGAWKETIAEQRKFFENHFSHQDAMEREKQQKQQRSKLEAEAAKKRHINTFEQDFGHVPIQYNTFKCAKCGTTCRVPANGKKLMVKCRCGYEFSVFSKK